MAEEVEEGGDGGEAEAEAVEGVFNGEKRDLSVLQSCCTNFNAAAWREHSIQVFLRQSSVSLCRKSPL